MELFVMLLHYTILLIICLTMVVQSTVKPGSKAFAGGLSANIKYKEQEHDLGNKQLYVHKPINLTVNFKAPKYKKVSSNTRPTQLPFNFVINTRPQTLPFNIPLKVKTGIVKPTSADYILLKPDLDRKQNLKTDLLIKESLTNKAIPKDAITKYENKNVSDHEDKKFLGNDHNNLPSAPTIGFSTSLNQSDPPKEMKSVTSSCNKLIDKAHKVEAENDCEKLNYENVTQNIDREYTDIQHNEEENHENMESTECKNKTAQDYKANESLNRKELEISTPFASKTDKVTLVSNKNDENPLESDCSDITTETILNNQPVTNRVELEDGLSDVVTITNHNYEEIEERSGSIYPAVKSLDEDISLWMATATTPANPFLNYHQNDQSINDQYLNTGDLRTYNNDHCRLDAPLCTYYSSDPEKKEAIYFRNKPQIVEDFYAQRTGNQNNAGNYPENPANRIWRKWKDTEIKLQKPNVLYYKIPYYVRNHNGQNYDKTISQTSNYIP